MGYVLGFRVDNPTAICTARLLAVYALNPLPAPHMHAPYVRSAFGRGTRTTAKHLEYSRSAIGAERPLCKPLLIVAYIYAYFLTFIGGDFPPGRKLCLVLATKYRLYLQKRSARRGCD